MSTNHTAKAASGSPGVEVDGLRQRLIGLGLSHAAESLAEELSEAVKHDRAGHVLLDRLLSHELSARDERRVRTSLKLSNLPPGMTLGNFDFAFQPSLDPRRIRHLATCEFVTAKSNVLFLGPPGVGKTMLAVALAIAACEAGFTIYFSTLEDVIRKLRAAHAAGRFTAQLNAYLRPHVLADPRQQVDRQ